MARNGATSPRQWRQDPQEAETQYLAGQGQNPTGSLLLFRALAAKHRKAVNAADTQNEFDPLRTTVYPAFRILT